MTAPHPKTFPSVLLLAATAFAGGFLVAGGDPKPEPSVVPTANLTTLLVISAGPIAIRWSKGNKDRGWSYYCPELVAVHLAHAKNFEDNVQVVGNLRQEVKALDLRRFLRN